uniref:Uncharacterized protein n=1 Tax=viral metagenome TaxID=1070528 RepID=A0A6M3K9P0_9ZZZZ
MKRYRVRTERDEGGGDWHVVVSADTLGREYEIARYRSLQYAAVAVGALQLNEERREEMMTERISRATSRAEWAAADLIGMDIHEFFEIQLRGDADGLDVFQDLDGEWVVDEGDYEGPFAGEEG